MTSWVEGRRMVPRTGASPSETDRALGFPQFRATRTGDACEISWAFLQGPPPTYPETWEWAVERSGSPGGPFRQISPWLSSSAPLWRDGSVFRGRENSRRPYYRVRFRGATSSGDELVFGYRPEWDTILPLGERHGFTWDEGGIRSAYSPPVVREARRRFSILSRNYSRELVALYREAWLEGVCDVCTDTRTGERVGTGKCSACFGTGMHGGYYQPLRLEVTRQDSGMISPQDIPQGTHDLREDEQVMCPFWPIPEPRDILRFANGSLFVIARTRPVEAWGYPVIHQVVLSQIPRTHALSALPLPATLWEESAGPRRQHGRAMNLEAYRESLTDGAMARASVRPPSEVPDVE